jgi:hypothetical protein
MLGETGDAGNPPDSRFDDYRVPSTLVKVIPLNRVFEIKSGKLTLVSLEVYEEGSILRFHILRPASSTPAPTNAVDMLLNRQNVKFRLNDDVGSSYRGMSGGGGGDSTNWEGSSRFWPRVPAEARQATLHVLEWSREPSAADVVLESVTFDL